MVVTEPRYIRITPGKCRDSEGRIVLKGSPYALERIYMGINDNDGCLIQARGLVGKRVNVEVEVDGAVLAFKAKVRRKGLVGLEFWLPKRFRQLFNNVTQVVVRLKPIEGDMYGAGY